MWRDILLICFGGIRFWAYVHLYRAGVSVWWFVLAEACISSIYLIVKTASFGSKHLFLGDKAGGPK